jgi:predicted AlkP superfamily phosphohydrolase/phosphomutase
MLDTTTRAKLEAVSHTINAARHARTGAKQLYEIAIEDMQFLYVDAVGAYNELTDEYNDLMQRYSKLADDHIAMRREYIASLESSTAVLRDANDAADELINTVNDLVR